MADESFTLLMKINKPEASLPRKNSLNPDYKRKKQRFGSNTHEKQKQEDASKHFSHLVEATKDAAKHLEEENIPYEIKIYRKNNEIFIDLVQIGKDGSRKVTMTKNITHDEYNDLLTHFDEGEGLFFDRLS